MQQTRTYTWAAEASPRTLLALWDDGQRSVPLRAGSEVKIGRAPDCTLVIDHPSVSRLHVVLRVDGQGGCALEDLGSSNRVSVNGTELPARATASLRAGDVVRFGAATLVLQSSAGAPASSGERAETLEELLALIAPSQLSVLIVGETGTGKERVAELIHAASLRPDGPFVRISCAGFTETLLESELFGHEKGAFTGADRAKVGLLEAANGGTFFFDELGEMPLAFQAKLLRAIESRKIRRVGGLEELAIDARFIAATHRDLEACCAAGTFRSDLYFRLNGVTLTVPPLRERLDQLPGLARQLIAQASTSLGVLEATLAPQALAALLQHRWPGNVRELRNVLERAVVLARGQTIEPRHLQIGAAEPAPAAPLPLKQTVEASERARIEQALTAAKGNQTEAARLLGIARRTLVKKLAAYNFGRPRRK